MQTVVYMKDLAVSVLVTTYVIIDHLHPLLGSSLRICLFLNPSHASIAAIADFFKEFARPSGRMIEMSPTLCPLLAVVAVATTASMVLVPCIAT